MSTYDDRLVALEKDFTVVKHDISYKLDETNSAVTILKGILGTLAQDVKIIKSQMKTVESQMKTMDLRLEGLDVRLARMEELQNEQGQAISGQGLAINDIKLRLDGQDKKLDDILALLKGGRGDS